MARSLERHPMPRERIERLMTIPAVGPITTLTWALEAGDVGRFSSIKKAIGKWMSGSKIAAEPPPRGTNAN